MSLISVCLCLGQCGFCTENYIKKKITLPWPTEFLFPPQKNTGESQCASVQIWMDVLHQCPGMLCSFQNKIRIQWEMSAFLQHRGCDCPGLISLCWAKVLPRGLPASFSSCTILRKEQPAPKQGQRWQHSRGFPGALDPVLSEKAQGGTFEGFYAKLKATATETLPWSPGRDSALAGEQLNSRQRDTEGFALGWASFLNILVQGVSPLSSAAGGEIRALGLSLFPVSRTNFLWHFEVWDGW